MKKPAVSWNIVILPNDRLYIIYSNIFFVKKKVVKGVVVSVQILPLGHTNAHWKGWAYEMTYLNFSIAVT